jgi:propanol-preferring alcohol dehydrogenase
MIGYRSLRLSNLPEKSRLGLYGFGASAHIVIQLARHLGHEVYVFTRSPKHRELATRLGASWVGGADERPAELDAAIIFAPAGALVLEALRAVRKAGTVTLAGITMSPIPQMDYSLIYQEKVLRSVANLTRQDAREFLTLAAEVPVRTEVQTYGLEHANQALSDMKHSRIEGAAVLRVMP